MNSMRHNSAMRRWSTACGLITAAVAVQCASTNNTQGTGGTSGFGGSDAGQAGSALAGMSGTAAGGTAGSIAGASGASGSAGWTGGSGGSGTSGASAGGSGGDAGQWVPLGNLGVCAIEQWIPTTPPKLTWSPCTGVNIPGCEQADTNFAGLHPADTTTGTQQSRILDDGTDVVILLYQGSPYGTAVQQFSVIKNNVLVTAFRRGQSGHSCFHGWARVSDEMALMEFVVNDDSPVPNTPGAVTYTFATKEAKLIPLEYPLSLQLHGSMSMIPGTLVVGGANTRGVGSVSPQTGGGVNIFATSSDAGPTIAWQGEATPGPNFFFLGEIYTEEGVPYRQRICKTDGKSTPIPYLSPTEPGTDLGAARYARSRIAWLKGINLVDPGSLNYDHTELWASEYAEDPANLAPYFVASSTNAILFPDGMVADWGRFALYESLTLFKVFNLETTTSAAIDVSPLFIQSAMGITRDHFYFATKINEFNNQGDYLMRVPLP